MVTAPVKIGSYRIERLLGIESFATVWLGYDASLGARVAIKVLAENWSYDLRIRERFLDEARMLWRLDDDRMDGELVAKLNPKVPHSARWWNYLLGGKDNLAPDRAVADAVVAQMPGKGVVEGR